MDGKQQASGSHQDQCTGRQQSDHSGSESSLVENVSGEPGEVTVSRRQIIYGKNHIFSLFI